MRAKSLKLHHRAKGISLVVTLLMIVVVGALAAAGARLAMSGERGARADRDRELAFQGAQAAIDDGTRDVMGLAGSTRGSDFCPSGMLGQPSSGCTATGADRGKCAPTALEDQRAPSWLTVDWDAAGVPIGTFTGGAYYPTQGGVKSWLPGKTPVYVIETVRDFQEDVTTGFGDGGGMARTVNYMITGVGYSSNTNSKVVLQQIVRKVKC